MVFALLVAACGSHAVVASRHGGNTKDSALAHQILAEQLGSLPRGVRRLGNEPNVYGASCRRRDGATARAVSSVLSADKGRVEVLVEDRVYPSGAAARRVVQPLVIKTAASCYARVVARLIRRSREASRYRVGPITVSAPKVLKAGTKALAVEISVPETFRDQHVVWCDDAVVVVQGRVVAGFSIVTPRSVLGYDARLARQLAEDTHAIENPTPTVGHFAGYHETDMIVHQLSATFTVPRIKPTASYADASTWVGAQVLGQDYLRLPFIQAGIDEDETDHQPPTDKAFWSDNAHHFYPVPLFSVRPGDKVSVSLTHARGHWIITAADGRTRRRIVTSQEGYATFTDAVWTQEDTDVGSHFYVYPRLTDVRISKLLVNGTAPAQWELSPDWMSTGHSRVSFKPTALTGDAFTVVPSIELADASQRCKQKASHQANLGAPIIDKQGPNTAVLFVDKRDNYTFFCTSEPNPPEATNALNGSDHQPAMAGPGYAAPPRDGLWVDDANGGMVCDRATKHHPSTAVGDMYGFAGSDIAGASFQFAHDPPIEAVVNRGFYIALWPYGQFPDTITVMTKSGTTVRYPVPFLRGCEPSRRRNSRQT